MTEPLQRVPAKPDGTRPETGPIQFGDDWPGIFIRGDNAMGYANLLEEAAKHVPQFDGGLIRGLVDTLRSCWIKDPQSPSR
jgi:hypothetical protein